MIGVQIDTTDTFSDLSKEEEVRFFAVGKDAVRAGTNRLRNAVRRNLRSIGSGRTYTIDGKSHTASAPGESPAKLAGKLARSISARVRVKKKEGSIDGVVQPSKSQRAKARWLEYGTATIAPRSFLRKAQMQEERAIGEDLRQAVND